MSAVEYDLEKQCWATSLHGRSMNKTCLVDGPLCLMNSVHYAMPCAWLKCISSVRCCTSAIPHHLHAQQMPLLWSSHCTSNTHITAHVAAATQLASHSKPATCKLTHAIQAKADNHNSRTDKLLRITDTRCRQCPVWSAAKHHCHNMMLITQSSKHTCYIKLHTHAHAKRKTTSSTNQR